MSSAPAAPEHLLVLEAGSNSLKMYVVDPGGGEKAIEVFKYPWSVAHEFFSTGNFSPATFTEICNCIRAAAKDAGGVHIASALAIATGVFREAHNRDALFARIRTETGVRMRIITGADEARLMARGLRDLSLEPPALLCDLGGATLEWVWLRRDHEPLFGSVLLGAIRNEYRLAPLREQPEAYLHKSDAICDAQLDALPIDEPVNVMFTGGTSEALAQIIGSDEISAAALDEVIGRVMRDGPPEDLKAARKKVLLPGLCIIRRVVARFGRDGLRYGTGAVRDGMIRRLLEVLDDVSRADLRATMLLRTRDGRHMLETALADALELGPGAKLGRYEVIEKLGRGSMGVVYRAADPELGRVVALKVMRARGGASDRLLGEAQALAQVRHPNVVMVHDVGRVGDDVFVAMELVEGLTLSAWCRAEKRTRDQILEVFLAAGRGLAATHDKKLVQRDFKPDNVIVGEDGRVCLVDFGLARFDSEQDELETGTSHASLRSITGVFGTPAYMAPEQFAQTTVDARTDQFSFCVALWEALYGQPPFHGHTFEALADAVMAGAIVSPPSRSEVPARLHEALRRGLSTRPDDRFPAMTDLLAQLVPTQPKAFSLGTLASVAAIVAVVVIVGAWAFSHPEPSTNLCSGAERQLEGIWDDDIKQTVHQAFLDTNLAYADVTFQRTQKILDGYAASWVVMSTDACEATLVREQQSQEVLAVRTACLDERLEELRALTTSLAGPLESNDIDKAVLRAFELPHIEDCNDVVSEPAVPATAEAGEAGKTEEELCGLPPAGHYNPISLGRTWVYDVLDPSTQLPRNKDPKVLTVEALEPIGGCKGDKKAYRLRDSAGPGYALRWIEVQEIESPEGYPSGQITWRHRDQYFTNDGVARMQEYFEPARIRLDESCQHTVARATYMDAYDEIGVAPDSACGEELSRQKKNFDWQVVGRDVPLRLRLNYAHKACCGRGRTCAPPPDGPGHSCRPTEGGGRNEWTCDFTTLEVTRSKVDGGKDATYWFAAGVGKVKEHSKGEEIETLVCFTIPDDP